MSEFLYVSVYACMYVRTKVVKIFEQFPLFHGFWCKKNLRTENAFKVCVCVPVYVYDQQQYSKTDVFF